jgi:3-methyladenine DNA glycosylase AlkD
MQKELLLKTKAQLESNIDLKYQKSMSGFVVGGKAKLYGVKVPVLRKIAAEVNKDLKSATDEQFLEFVDKVYAQGSHEEKHLACYLVEKRKSVLGYFNWRLIKKWSAVVDNWANNDVLACLVIGPWVVLNFEERIKYLEQFIDSKNLWHRRLALVSMIMPIRAQKGVNVSLRFVSKVAKERDPMITKAVSWLLREMVRKGFSKEVTAYLKANKNVLAPLVVREVINKLTTGLKNPKK